MYDVTFFRGVNGDFRFSKDYTLPFIPPAGSEVVIDGRSCCPDCKVWTVEYDIDRKRVNITLESIETDSTEKDREMEQWLLQNGWEDILALQA